MTARPALPRAARLVFVAGAVAYLCAVTQRSTLGVAGVAAADRFAASASALSTLAVLQLVVYALLQVPVGVLVDRFGPRRILLTGAVLMVAGQVLVAVAPVLPLAVAGRMLVGAGDATTFISVLRLVAGWFPPRRVPVVSQWLGGLGATGQVLSAVPFAVLLQLGGWERAFLAAAGLSGLGLVVLVLLVVDPPGAPADRVTDLREAVRAVRASVRQPGTRLGFWAHFVTQSSGVVFALLWGFPFLVTAVGLAPAAASALLVVQVAAGVVAGPVLGVLTARHPLRRSNLVLAVVLGLAAAWSAVLLWPGTPPVWLLVVLLVALGVGGPASQIGFDYARTFNPARRLGGANGVVNVGGFTASFTMMFLIGAALDAHAAVTGAPPYSLDGFRVAFAVQLPVVGAGVVALYVARRRTRRRMAQADGTVVGPFLPALGAAVGRRVRPSLRRARTRVRRSRARR